MKDLVKILREHAEDRGYPMCDVLREAADEIERLRRIEWAAKNLLSDPGDSIGQKSEADLYAAVYPNR